MYEKETAWSNAKVNGKIRIKIERNQSSIVIDPYECAKQNIDGLKTVVHVQVSLLLHQKRKWIDQW